MIPKDVQASAPGAGTLRRSITLGQLIFFGLVFIGPAAAVGIFGTLDAKSSGAVATVGALLSPTTPAELAANPGLEGAAYYNAVGTSIRPWLHWLLALSKAAGAAFAAMVGQGAGSRIIMDMARERRLPGGTCMVCFGARGGRDHVPAAARR